MKTLIISLATAGLLALAGSASADVIGGDVTGGSAFGAGGTFVQLTVPWGSVSTPANTVGDNNFNTPDLYAFDESQNFTLTANLATEVGLNPVLAGTVVSSQYVFFDPGPTENLIGHVDFNTRVLAIITSDAGLTASNFLGDSGINYRDPVDVGLEPGDLVTIDTTNPDQIDWDTSASNPGDSVRVITAATPTATTPEPASILMLGTGLLGLVGIKRKLFS